MSEAFTILEEADEANGVAVLTLDRAAKRNALSRALRDEIVARLEQLARHETVRAVVLTGAGPVFCAGFDRSEFAGGGAMEEVFAQSMSYHRRVYEFPKPLIAAVQGPALGGGLDLAAMCDLRLASTTASFGQPQVRFGAAALYELMQTLIGTGAAREICLTGRVYTAEEAHRMGLVNQVFAPEALLPAAKALAEEIASLPGELPAAAKRGFVARQPGLFRS